MKTYICRYTTSTLFEVSAFVEANNAKEAHMKVAPVLRNKLYYQGHHHMNEEQIEIQEYNEDD